MNRFSGWRASFWRAAARPGLLARAGGDAYLTVDRLQPVRFRRAVRAVFPSRDPALFWRLDAGGTVLESSSGHVTGVPEFSAGADYSLLYGLPGKPGYGYDRPFDYFDFEIAAGTGPDNLPSKIITKGLLVGTDYEAGESYRGVWGLYGSFDYINPNDFRVGTGAVDVGTNGQWRLSERTALQLSALTGIGYGAAGTVPGANPDYHHGGAAQGLLNLRFILGDLATIEAGQREYYIDQFGSSKPKGNELMGRTEAGITVRIVGNHAISFRFLSARRDEYPPGTHNVQTMNEVTLSYTYLSDERFGAVEWRNGEGR